jgi:solute carrier family 35 (UDP-galactose transporter), member B1
VGVIGLYSGYAYLQESLLADKEKKMNTNFVLLVMNAIAIALSSSIIKLFGMGNLLDQF